MSRPASQDLPRRIYLDLTHLGRHVTGIERIAIELFEKVPFEGADVRPVRARGTLSMILMQHIWLPLLALFSPRATFIFPGFPPAPWFVFCRDRVVWYVHDLFLMTRQNDLSTKAKLYMAPPFRFAISRLKFFFVNSQKTAAELKPFAAPDATITLYRPRVENVFNLETNERERRPDHTTPLKLVSLGTVEPRKNYTTAIAIRDALEKLGLENVELHIIGRAGWGNAHHAVQNHPNVIVHGYLNAEDVKRILEAADIYLCTSFDEGLGLPLLEAQHAGLPVFAPDSPVFREVLDTSGHYISTDDSQDAANKIASLVDTPGWRASSTAIARANPERWNSQAEHDAVRAQKFFTTELADGLQHVGLGQS